MGGRNKLGVYKYFKQAEWTYSRTNLAKKHFETMEFWGYENSNVLKLKYEDVIDHEEERDERHFYRHGFPVEWLKDWLAIVSKYTRKNAIVAEKSHTRNGNAQQWLNVFDEFFSKRLTDGTPIYCRKPVMCLKC